MKYILHILLFPFLAFSCSGQAEYDHWGTNSSDSTQTEMAAQHNGDHYINEHGEIYIFQLNDTSYQTTWINNEGFTFDTVMYVAKDDENNLYRPWKDHTYLKYHYGGVIILGDELWVQEFSSYGKLGSEAKMFGMYERKFFRADKEVNLEGRLTYSKGHAGLQGIYFDPNPSAVDKYYQIRGKIRKEHYPESFLSTDESPQGLGGVDENSYRLVFESYELIEPTLSIYAGTAVNNSKGEPCIAWDFADSEAYKLENREAWMGDEAGMRIFVEGYLTQDNWEGSVLRNWTMNLAYKERKVSGTTTNLNGNGGIAPNDNLVLGYELEGHGTWPEDEVNKGITVTGTLYAEGGSLVLKNWKILN